MASEHQIQAAFVQWCKLNERKYPELKLAFAIPNGGHRNVITATRLKAEGVRPGVPDWCLPVARRGFAGLWIEFKKPGGKETETQAEYAKLLLGENHYSEVVMKQETAKELVEWYLAKPAA